MSLFTSTNITSLGLIGVIVAQVVMQIRSGRSGLTDKMLTDYKARNLQLEDILARERQASEVFKKSMSKVIDDYTIEITRLRTSNDEKDAHNKTLKEILQDKNPEVIEVLKDIRDFMKLTNTQNTKVLNYQTEILEKIKERSDRIDKASHLEKGQPMLVPAV